MSIEVCLMVARQRPEMLVPSEFFALLDGLRKILADSFRQEQNQCGAKKGHRADNQHWKSLPNCSLMNKY